MMGEPVGDWAKQVVLLGCTKVWIGVASLLLEISAVGYPSAVIGKMQQEMTDKPSEIVNLEKSSKFNGLFYHLLQYEPSF